MTGKAGGILHCVQNDNFTQSAGTLRHTMVKHFRAGAGEGGEKVSGAGT